MKLFVNIIQFDVGALRRGNLILAFNGKRLDAQSMDETLRCFKLVAPTVKGTAVPQIIVIAGNNYLDIYFLAQLLNTLSVSVNSSMEMLIYEGGK